MRDAAIPAAGDGSDRRVETQDYDYDIYPNPDAAPSGLQRVSPREEEEAGGALDLFSPAVLEAAPAPKEANPEEPEERAAEQLAEHERRRPRAARA